MKFNVDWMLRKWRAITWIVVGQRARAITVFEEMLQAYPNDSYALGSLAHLKAELGDKKGAIAAYEVLVTQNNAPAYAWFNLGFLQQESEHPVEAEASFRRALIQQGRLDEAVQALERNTQLQPMSPYAWYQLGRVHMDRQAPDETTKIIKHLKGFEPKFAAQLERETGLAVSA
jgi:tetratricopeptide (TPR) repeat protein